MSIKELIGEYEMNEQRKNYIDFKDTKTESESEVCYKINNIVNKLIDDIIKQAKKSKVRVLDIKGPMMEAYEISTLEEYLYHCDLPNSIVKFAETIECDEKFIMNLYNIAEEQNKVPSFQFAVGDTQNYYFGESKMMTTEYEIFKRIIHDELSTLAEDFGNTIKEFLNKHKVYIRGNDLGKELFNRYLNELEEKYNTTGIEKMAELYKQSLKKEKENNLDFELSVFNSSAKRRYETDKRDLVVDIIKQVMNEGISILYKNMPENINKFIELSGCEDEEILDLYRRAAEKAEDYKIAYMYFGDDLIVLIRDYVTAYKFLQSLVENTSKTLAELELDPRSNSLAQEFLIKYLAEKAEKIADDWNLCRGSNDSCSKNEKH